MADAHKKRQKQIRMGDDVRARFDAAQKASGLTGEEFITQCLDALTDRERRENSYSNGELAEMAELIAGRLRDKADE